MMKKLLLATVFSTAVLFPALQAVAADLDVEPPPPPVAELRPATYDWSGLYVGGWLGLTCLDGTLTENGVGGQDWENSGCGYKGGVMGGYNHQIDSFVVGIEADWGKSGIIATNEEPGADFAFAMDHIATVRARFGVAFDDTLIFATAGGAWAKGDLDGIIAADPDHIKASHKGWTLGGGMEHALTDNFRLRLDYLYTKFEGANYYSTSCAATCDVDINDFGDHEVRIGAIWAF